MYKGLRMFFPGENAFNSNKIIKMSEEAMHDLRFAKDKRSFLWPSPKAINWTVHKGEQIRIDKKETLRKNTRWEVRELVNQILVKKKMKNAPRNWDELNEILSPKSSKK